ncbi:hypothetical protein [Spirulina subsalsa]|uniref:hypothetical protein n=1 Tax=Spirulina subsalsa TaxID=54311 RepID=UPI00031A6974|nr:hypothetical protein [Spirulina subsalsa]
MTLKSQKSEREKCFALWCSSLAIAWLRIKTRHPNGQWLCYSGAIARDRTSGERASEEDKHWFFIGFLLVLLWE